MLNPITHRWILHNEMQTLDWGRRFADFVEPAMVVSLYGDLGAGKTTLTRGVLEGLGYSGRVKSPTYPILETYSLARLYFYHFDFYRICDKNELEDSGFRENFGGLGVCFVEWPEKAQDWLPSVDIKININILDNQRELIVTALSKKGVLCLEKWQKLGW
ncbi:MAG: tRNA (adenosine(37)-N6)-threonylcarbamoyltransferase complex ATPase subunit type 1 TsaE [Ferrovum sp. 37-45-19]|uniref:tRNA (adenosine(37)-N6)-threonylcarbamoyltransferase complex ATPase subunit type 1 TsaE n=1 Tax=Ferrovum sp. JA12 TaxID=1356299 RepID=UPI000702ADE1|nr:tRNA (adenosine(37)-N6)-threonylcarbamoyltransferase complex ATPase subunit type 1 TsaE [Ferrovum sp. JA12]OYV80218.1 MAG: tRNA (adenosine(37)-N6)-threonylcarbamoyltransferase complex ATPase subunit type 1 TsaE [Ferrovum sp. 21-44-67]OYV94495.1 MAG: tRNA (adenosine(37)-N6)-threonylcarbamoyltransferase complex ATPase subunit type 1 TsaE [Ferrovum sp. 37-45-19]OZB33883.1 MAG: tRNA (adenosine(37)-N6)-threonylcarbamoyltransferase complex ATPase subunit type 1 TsaE [Ferrovum sp. 34-44-207]HQT8160